jgi:hypothetical protein
LTATSIHILKAWRTYDCERSLEAFAQWLREHPGPDVKPTGDDNADELHWLATPAPDASGFGHPKYTPKNGFDFALTHGAFFDVDGPACVGPAFEASIGALEAAGVGYVYSRSHSADESKPFKGHVQLVYAEPCPAEYHAAVWRALHAAFFSLVDIRQHSPVRGRNAPRAGAPIHVQAGALVDWRYWLARTPARTALAPVALAEASTQRADDDERVAKLLVSVWAPKTTGDRAFGGLGGWLARLGVSRERATRIAQGISFMSQSTHPNVERRIDQAFDGEHGLGFTSLRESLSTDAAGVVALADGGRSLGGVEIYVRDVLQQAELLLRNSVTPAPVEQAAPEPKQDLSGLQLAPGGWPWILRKGQWCWLHELERQAYWGPIEKADIKLQVRRTHCHVVALRGDKGADIKEEDFERLYQQRIDSLRATYLARANSWDAAKRELTLSTLKWNPLPPTFHPDVDVWLRTLGGPVYDRLAQWLASCVALDRPAPALYIHGEAKVGKTLLAVGLAKLWCTAPAPFKESLSDFNEAAAKCPLIFADEGFPDGMSFVDFREMVTAPSRRVNEKFKAKVSIEGCVRIVLAANNANALRYQRTGVLTAADIEAIADRLLVVHASPAAAEALKGTNRNTMAEHRIAEHVLWLAQVVQLEGVDERMCARPHGALTILDALQTARYADVMRKLAQLTPAEKDREDRSDEFNGVFVRSGTVWVNVPALFKACQSAGLNALGAYPPKEQDVRDFVNAFRSGPVGAVWIPKPDQYAPGRTVKAHPIDMGRVRTQLTSLE